MIQQTKLEAAGNYAMGALGFTLSLADLTSFFQCVGAIAGAVLVCVQLYRSLRKK